MNTGIRQRIRLLPVACDLSACLAAFCAVSRIFTAAHTNWLVAVPASALASLGRGHRAPGPGVRRQLVDRSVLLRGRTDHAGAIRPRLRLRVLARPVNGHCRRRCPVHCPLAFLRKWVHGGLAGARSGVLFLGFDSVAAALTPFFGRQIVGVVESDPERVPGELAYLGPPEDLAKTVAETRPSRIVVAGGPASPRMWLEAQYAGTPVMDGAALHENLLGRLRWDALRPMDLLFSRSTNADRRGMAVQSVYTNVIGLALILVLSPLLILPAAAIALFGRGGPVLEHTACLGFQMIPFDLLRFGTRGRDGRPHAIGRALLALHLAFLPRLINVVRGEMAFFGPPPVRLEFARRLDGLIPVYAHRFTVKPGILGWSQMHLGSSMDMADEALRLEYDLYYVKQNSVSLDLEILLRSVFPLRSALRRESRAEQAGTV